MGVSFKTCLRRRGDVMMGRRCYVFLRLRYDVPIRRRRDAPLRRRWVFHLRRTCDVTGTYREMSLRRLYDVLMPGGILVFAKLSTYSDAKAYVFSVYNVCH